MAKPIGLTPVLSGKDAEVFLRKMRKRETAPITKKDRELAKRLEKFKICV